MNKETLLKPLKKRALPVTGSSIFLIISIIVNIFDIDIGDEEKKQLSAAIAGLSTVLFSSRNFILSLFDKQKAISEDILNRMNEKDAKEDFNNKFPSVLRKEAADIIKIKNLEEPELIEVINKGVEKSIEIFTPVLIRNFLIPAEELTTILLPKKVNIEVLLLQKNFNIENKEDFAAFCGEITLSEIETFILNFTKLQESEIKNGVRRRSFETLCLKMVNNIITKAINEFKKTR